MAEPQPSTIHEGAETPPAPPAGGAAAASEAAALSSLDNKTISGSDSAPKKEVDLKALNDAMKALGSGEGSSKKAATAGTIKKEEPAKSIKVEAADVGLLAEHLDMSRTKATELLRAHDANAVKAMKAWVSASV